MKGKGTELKKGIGFNFKENKIRKYKEPKPKKSVDTNIRFNLLSFLTYACGIIILSRLFTLQIVDGASYRETSNTKISRETTIQSTRGDILDRNGTVLVSSEMTFSLEMYKSKSDNESLNSSISLMTKILEDNGDTYTDKFPISIDPFEYHFSSEEKLAEWKEKYKIPEAASAEEAFYIFRDKYEIASEDVREIRRILAIRYQITTVGYSAIRPLDISSSISRNSAVQLQENSMNLTGVNVVTDSNRIYYMGNLASHIIGYMGRIRDTDQKKIEAKGLKDEYDPNDKIGQTGIESVFETYLKGKDGVKQIDMDVYGTITGEYVTQEAIGGSDVVLTIDANLQNVLESSLAQCISNIQNGHYGRAYNAKGGAAVVVDVHNGEILAMASNPDYTPEAFYNGISQELWDDYQNRKVLLNKTTQGAYSPGSTFKMVTAIAGLETGAITPDERINDTGVYVLNDMKYKCWIFDSAGYGHGALNVSGAIQKSCNFFFYETGRRVGIDTLSRYAKYFGLGRKTGIELSGEVAGSLSQNRDGWTTGLTLISAIGQGENSFTPIQMAKYIAMVANGGHNIDLTVVKDVINSNGGTVSSTELEQYVNNELNLENTESENIEISSQTIDIIKDAMRSVTDDRGGTAESQFRGFGITVGGKTGSAETGSEAGADVNAWFVGFAPYEDPQIAVVVMVENGGHGYYTAEVLKAIVQEYFGTNTESVRENMSVESEMESFN